MNENWGAELDLPLYPWWLHCSHCSCSDSTRPGHGFPRGSSTSTSSNPSRRRSFATAAVRGRLSRRRVLASWENMTTVSFGWLALAGWPAGEWSEYSHDWHKILENKAIPSWLLPIWIGNIGRGDRWPSMTGLLIVDEDRYNLREGTPTPPEFG